MVEFELEERRDVRVDCFPITSLAVHPTLGFAIVVKKTAKEADEDIVEQWTVRCGWMAVRERMISVDGRVEGAAWVGDVAVLVLLDGRVGVVDPHGAVVTRQITASSLFAVAPLDNTRCAVISHSSAVHIIAVPSLEVLDTRHLGVESRLFSLAARGKSLAIGGMDHIWMVDTEGAPLSSLPIERGEKRLPTIVWSVAFVRDDLLVCGDSRGVVSFFSLPSLSLIKAIHQHRADVLCVLACAGRVYAAGVDPSIFVIEERNGKWMDSLTKRMFTRDVHCLASWGDVVFAAGADGSVLKVRPQTLFYPTPIHKDVIVNERHCLVRRACSVEVWSTGEQPLFLFKVFSHLRKIILAMASSEDGRYLAVSTNESTVVFEMSSKDIKLKEKQLPWGENVLFSGGYLYISSCSSIHRVSTCTWETEHFLQVDDLISCLRVSDQQLALITSRCVAYLVSSLGASPRPLKVDSPLDVAFTPEGLFVLSSNKPSLLRFSGDVKPVSQLMAHQLFSSGEVASIWGGAMLVAASDGGQWAAVGGRKVLHTEDASPGGPVVCYCTPSRLLVYRIQTAQPAALPFNRKAFGMK